ncbi:hypothetical protein R3P38DRAFT_3075206 [Favolaschia claudopus]|uniref:Uncharacterized protein n=1 Tax=Favolaschia claudopus TaxID=2862362 RepID=A0AAV9ZYS2_9AGAR
MSMAQEIELPIFPPDLEREIFETSALLHPVSIPKLMLVACRARDCPLCGIYAFSIKEFRVALDPYPLFTWDILLRAMRSKPASFFHSSVRNLCILDQDAPGSSAREFLSLCTGVTNLSIWGRSLPPTHYAHLRPHRLTSFAMDLNHIISPTHEFFSRLTHLEARNFPFPTEWPEFIDHLSRLPSLTHFSVYSTSQTDLQQVLDACSGLRVVILLYCREAPSISDRRFVALKGGSELAEWQMGAYTGEDYWSFGEEVIAKRPPGPVNEYRIFEYVSSIRNPGMRLREGDRL